MQKDYKIYYIHVYLYNTHVCQQETAEDSMARLQSKFQNLAQRSIKCEWLTDIINSWARIILQSFKNPITRYGRIAKKNFKTLTQG